MAATPPSAAAALGLIRPHTASCRRDRVCVGREASALVARRCSNTCVQAEWTAEGLLPHIHWIKGRRGALGRGEKEEAQHACSKAEASASLKTESGRRGRGSR